MTSPPASLSLYVESEAFRQECATYSRDLHSSGSSSNTSDSGYSSGSPRLQQEGDGSSVSSKETSPYEVSEAEAEHYYDGIRAPRKPGPKLIYRTSKDIFKIPSEGVRTMRLLTVQKDDLPGADGKWPQLAAHIVELLDQSKIKISTLELARFSRLESHKDADAEPDEGDSADVSDGHGECNSADDSTNDNEGEVGDQDDGVEEDVEDEDDADVCPYGKKVVITPVTIWVGVLPDTLSGDIAHHASNKILDFLKNHGISDIDIAFRESVAVDFSHAGPELYAPASDRDPLKEVLDPLSTGLGLPIANSATLHIQGTMGFYFRAEGKLYAVTARHVAIPESQGISAYEYNHGEPKRNIVLMGTAAFKDFLKSIQGHIGTLNYVVDDTLPKQIRALTARAAGRGPNAQQAATELLQAQDQLKNTQSMIKKLKEFFIKVKMEWSDSTARIIGHVVWAPSISVGCPPHHHTKDVCVIELDERKFLQNFRGNVLDLGSEIDPKRFTHLMNPHINAPSNFDYPAERLLRLQGIMSAEEMPVPDNMDPVHYVIKRGLKTRTTIGCLNGFESFVRRYSSLPERNSLEVAIYPHDSKDYNVPFSARGDSGSVIIDGSGKFVALLTGGTEPPQAPDITYGTPMHWLWPIIKMQFPGASLYPEGHDD